MRKNKPADHDLVPVLNAIVRSTGKRRRTANVWSFLEGRCLAARQVASPNYGMRPLEMPISLVILHAISLPPGKFGGGEVEALFTNRLDYSAHPYFATLEGVRVSTHFFLRRDGELVQFVNVAHRAWHAGLSTWRGQNNCNDFSVGIELEGDNNNPYTEAQYAVLQQLLAALFAAYPTLTEVVGHQHVAPERKTDPGPCFEWARLRTQFPNLGLPEAVPEIME
ncbi:MAG: 1,6-anhydro-N-acetylmuramyl-L-alanine amidase AmpD [Zoogloeaceae bacterium]|jgi:AmpD protein|nr:1,6-anhydro-N-acetylmuramyl-L-alanine amidase AmpD [Zoogloeaceae bacterium]